MDCNKHIETWNATKFQPSVADGIRYAALEAAAALEALAQRLECCDFDSYSRDNIVSALRVRFISDWLSVAKYAEQYRPEVAWEACAAVASAPYGVAVDRGGYRSSSAARYLKRARGQITTITRAGG